MVIRQWAYLLDHYKKLCLIGLARKILRARMLLRMIGRTRLMIYLAYDRSHDAHDLQYHNFLV